MLFLGSAAFSAEECGFEGVPGTLPAPWYCFTFDSPVKDICMISNMDAFSGKTCLLLDHSLPEMAQRRTLLFPVKECVPGKRHRFSFVMKPQASGITEFLFDCSVWTGKGPFFGFGIKRGGVNFHVKSVSLPEHSVKLGVWQRVTFELPGKDETTGLFRLECWNGTEFVNPKEVVLPMNPSELPYKTFRMVCSPGQYVLWIDDFVSSPVD